MINGHGDDLYLYNEKIKYNFSSNVYYHGCNKKLLTSLQNSIQNIQNYPSPAANELNILAAKQYALPSNHFLFTNGATEAFYLIAQHFKNKTATIIAPTFAEYQDACQIHHIKTHLVPHKNLTKNTTFTTKLVFLCNPNNPDGKVVPLNCIKQILTNNPNTYFIIDEAYYEFTTNFTSVINILSDFNNLIIVRSLTKTFAIPGLRLGFAIANPTLIAQLQSLKMPWSVNQIAIEAGKYIFNHYKPLLFNNQELIEETTVFKKNINQIDGFEVIEGNCSFFLVKLTKTSAFKLKEHLRKKHQILIRDATNFKGLNGEYIRLSVQQPTANTFLINALKKWE